MSILPIQNALLPNLSLSSKPSSLLTLKNPFTSLIPKTHKKAHSAVTMMSMEAGIGVMATKLGMMSLFEPGGKVVPVTVVGFKEGNIVTQVKTQATDGYDAVQVGYRRIRDRKLTKPEMGHLQKAGTIPLRHLQEFRLQDIEGFEPRQLGSIGAGTTPGRVYKGKKMPGRMGGTKTKIRKLKIVKIDKDLNVVMINGALPGKPGNLLRITPAKIVGKNIPKS
ncbi:hypothetical protein M0R45_035244 [Rubus argutus]|uniref:Large ribosomal subunit protein uL3c n=1 Tax=Rubus argutus TaxID=59490 RepID=A0AAW1VTE2_RUBAR